MGEYLKTDLHVIERILNHQPINNLVATYQRATYVQEQKAAWLAWGKMVENKVAQDSAYNPEKSLKLFSRINYHSKVY